MQMGADLRPVYIVITKVTQKGVERYRTRVPGCFLGYEIHIPWYNGVLTVSQNNFKYLHFEGDFWYGACFLIIGTIALYFTLTPHRKGNDKQKFRIWAMTLENVFVECYK